MIVRGTTSGTYRTVCYYTVPVPVRTIIQVTCYSTCTIESKHQKMMRAYISVMVCLAAAKVQHRPPPHRSGIRSVVQEGLSSGNFVRLKGGGIASPNASVLEQKNRPDKSGLTMALVCVTIVTIWIGTATLIFARNEDWPLAQSLFYAVDTGMSIGFGAVSEKKLSTKLFTIVHVLLGASAVGGAIALFAESVVESSPTLGKNLNSQQPDHESKMVPVP